MEDEEIIALFWQRSEDAIGAAAGKYGGYCRSIAGSILADVQDAEECVNDTWLRAWNAMPPHRPDRLALFLGKITRELAINRRKALSARKRGGGEYDAALDELAECVPAPGGDAGAAVELELLGQAVSAFLRRQPEQAADMFVRRYYHLRSIRQLSGEFGVSESKVKSTLFRMRKKLHAYLESEEWL